MNKLRFSAIRVHLDLLYRVRNFSKRSKRFVFLHLKKAITFPKKENIRFYDIYLVVTVYFVYKKKYYLLYKKRISKLLLNRKNASPFCQVRRQFWETHKKQSKFNLLARSLRRSLHDIVNFTLFSIKVIQDLNSDFWIFQDKNESIFFIENKNFLIQYNITIQYFINL